MRIVKTITFLLYLLSICVLASPKITATINTISTDKTTLTIAITKGGYYPFYYQENDKLTGFSIDIIHYFKANSAFNFEFITLQWPRALDLVARGKIDLILTLFKTPYREHVYHFIEPAYGNEINQLFSLTDTNIDFNGQLSQLTPYAIGTLREYSYGAEFDKAQYLKKRPALTENVLLKLLLNQQIDVIIGNPFKFNQLITAEQLGTKIKAITPHVAITPVYMALTQKRTDAEVIKQTLSQLMQQLKTTDYYLELLKKYRLGFH